MSEPDFTNREIIAMFDGIKTQLNRIEEQTVKTNGRVTKLEVKHEGLLTKVGAIATVISAVVIAGVNKLFP